jgi:hypothetical protein
MNWSVVKFDPLALAFYKCVIVAESHTAANMHNDTFNLVHSCSFYTVYFQFGRVWNTVTQFLMLIGLFVEFEPLEMSEQNFRARLYLDFLCRNLFCETLLAVQFVRLVQKLLATKPLDTVIKTSVFLNVKREVVKLLTTSAVRLAG